MCWRGEARWEKKSRDFVWENFKVNVDVFVVATSCSSWRANLRRGEEQEDSAGGFDEMKAVR